MDETDEDVEMLEIVESSLFLRDLRSKLGILDLKSDFSGDPLVGESRIAFFCINVSSRVLISMFDIDLFVDYELYTYRLAGK